jgi:hypothetical protein
MQPVRIVFSVALLAALVSCKPLSPEVTSKDCTAPVPAGFTRIFIGNPAHGGKLSGTSFDDPLDGSTAQKFDAILRSIANGQHPTWGAQSNIAPENLIVCLTKGTFQTNGQHDWSIEKANDTSGNGLGFTAEKNWKIHGRGVAQTKLQLASYVPHQYTDLNGAPINGGRNVVLGTHSAGASGIEVSDLTIDTNHDGLTSTGGVPLSLEGIVLRSDQGGHWIHDVNVTGGSGDVGFSNVVFETFTVRIWGNVHPPDPQQNTNNLIEHVNVSNPGLPVLRGSPPGGAVDGIVVNNAVAEVRNNVVDGYTLGFGGWAMGAVSFHDNVAKNCKYGFNTDSFSNSGVMVESNQIVHPGAYGIVIGGGDGSAVFKDWNVFNNSIQLNQANSVGLVLRGQVQNATFSGNTIAADGSARNLTAIWSYPAASGLQNLGNTFQNNQIDKTLTINFAQDPNFNTNCRFQNRDLQGQARQDFPDNSSAKCR